MLGWFNEEMVRASRSKRSLASGLSARCGGRILMATLRSRRVSRARYTSPIPPAPSGAPISYGPSFVPEESPMVALGLYSPSREGFGRDPRNRWIWEIVYFQPHRENRQP